MWPGENVTTTRALYLDLGLGFGRNRRQIVGVCYALEIDLFVRAIAKRFALGMTAAAERQHRSASETKRLPFLIQDFDFTFHAQWPIVANHDFHSSHLSSDQRLSLLGD